MALTWAKRIEQLREVGINLVQIGRLAGTSTSAISDLASGRTKQPRGEAALKIDALHRSKCQSAARAA